MAPPRAPPWESSSGLGPKASPGRLHRRKCNLVFFDFLGIEPSDFTDILQSRRFPGRRNSGREKEIDHRISHPAVQVAIGGVHGVAGAKFEKVMLKMVEAFEARAKQIQEGKAA